MTFRILVSKLDTAVLRHIANDMALIDGISVSGAFRDAYIDALSMQSIAPVFSCQASSVDSSVIDKMLVYDGILYIVRECQPDGAGWVNLILEKQ